MNHSPHCMIRRAAGGLLLVAAPLGVLAQPISLAQSPMYLGTLVKPNVLVVYDNSESMDGTMAGQLIAGDDPSTRGNIARSVIRSTITSFRNSFNWGLGSFGLANGPGLYTTYAYYFGSDSQVVYTNDCVGGISASNGGLRCVANPEPSANGYRYITYNLTGDDPSINDVLYAGYFGNQLYGIGVYGSTAYQVFGNHGSGSGWSPNDFGGGYGTWGFTPTDAGYLPQTPPNSRMFWLLRAWGYYSDINGGGIINQAVAPDSSSQYNSLMTLLAAETSGGNGELKNAAVFTPLAGTMNTVKSYFANTLGGTSTPITQSCQRNFVMLATDGNPTGRTDGSMYDLSQQQNTYNGGTGSWNFSQAANDVFNGITALRSTSYNSKAYDIQTYVVGLGDTVANASSIAELNQFALLGGTGKAYLASNQAALQSAFNQISVDIVAKTSAASAVSVNSGAWNNGSSLYQGRFNSGDWSGQLLAYTILASGTPSSNYSWDSGQILNGQNFNTGRQILTYKPSAALGSRGVAFRWPANANSPGATEIDAGMVSALNTSSSGSVDGYGSQRLPFLRGDPSLELRNCASCSAPTFRNRPSTVLGDIVNSAPLYVGGPSGNYRDSMSAAPYSGYAATRLAQTPVLYVGANDGMLHAFNATNGSELFAYVPWAVRNRLSALTDPAYLHQYTVDGSPSVGDLYYDGAWHSLLVSGMNAGAPGLFALDVSDPSKFTENHAASVVRWEVDNSDADVGYVFSKPAIVPLRDGSWRVIVGNGYNSTNGHAVLLLIDARSGAITRLDTQSGSSATPNGLSGVVTVSSANNGVVDIVYAGDLNGNLWKFDLSSSSASNWKVAYGTNAAPSPLFSAASGQAISSRPDVTITPAGNYLVTFGTGRYLSSSDISTTTAQALYGIIDTGAPATIDQLQVQLVASTGTGSDNNTYRLTTHAVGASNDGIAIAGDNMIPVANYYANDRGWKMTLPTSGERMVSDATIRYGRVSFSTMIPSTDVCTSGGSGWIMELDALTGNRSPAFDVNGDGSINPSDYVSGMMPSGIKINAIPAAATTIREQNPKLDDKLINTSDGSVAHIIEQGNTKPSRRASWEQIQ